MSFFIKIRGRDNELEPEYPLKTHTLGCVFLFCSKYGFQCISFLREDLLLILKEESASDL